MRVLQELIRASSDIRHHSVRYTSQAWALVPCLKVGVSAKAGSWIYSLRGSTTSHRFVQQSLLRRVS
jgi:hypothetical protein